MVSTQFARSLQVTRFDLIFRSMQVRRFGFCPRVSVGHGVSDHAFSCARTLSLLRFSPTLRQVECGQMETNGREAPSFSSAILSNPLT